MRMQTIVSRQVSTRDSAVVRIGLLQDGTKENIIPDKALIKLNVPTFAEGARRRVLAAIERIAKAEAAASGAPSPPEITPLDQYSSASNDARATKKLGGALLRNFPPGSIEQT